MALDADNNMSHTDDLNAFLYWSGCYGVPEDVTVALLLDDSTAMTAQLYAPQADSAAAELLEDAVGHNEMGAAFIDYNGTAYVVAVFRKAQAIKGTFRGTSLFCLSQKINLT